MTDQNQNAVEAAAGPPQAAASPPRFATPAQARFSTKFYQCRSKYQHSGDPEYLWNAIGWASIW